MFTTHTRSYSVIGHACLSVVKCHSRCSSPTVRPLVLYRCIRRRCRRLFVLCLLACTPELAYLSVLPTHLAGLIASRDPPHAYPPIVDVELVFTCHLQVFDSGLGAAAASARPLLATCTGYCLRSHGIRADGRCPVQADYTIVFIDVYHEVLHA